MSVETAVNITAAGFVQSITPEFRSDVTDHMLSSEICYTVQEGGQTLGFALFNLIGEDILYLSGIIIMPAGQGKGIGPAMIRKAAQTTGAKYLSLRTQSSRMYRAMHDVCQRVYPILGSNHPMDSDLLQVGEQTSREIGSSFPVGHGHYGGPLYGEKPVHADQQLQEQWDGLCEFSRGDAVICVGELSL